MNVPNSFNIALQNYLLKRKTLDDKSESLVLQQQQQQQQQQQIYSPFTPELSCEGLSDILKDVVAFVEFRGTCEDRSDAIAHHLSLLGATVSKYFSRKVTHVFFRNGRLSTFKKATQWDIPIVSVCWIEACKLQKKIVPEKDFAADIPEEYTCPYLFGKIKRFKSMEPKLLAEFDVTKSLENKFKRQQKRRIRKECMEFCKMSPDSKIKNMDNLCRFRKEMISTFTPMSVNDDDSLSNNTPVSVRTNRKRKLFSPGKDELLDFTPDETFPPDVSLKSINRSTSVDSGETSMDFHTDKENDMVIKTKKTERKLKITPRRSLNCSRRSAAIVLSSVHKNEVESLNAIVAQLGRFRIVFNVDETTSHVICGAPRRTLNVLYALARGCWVLSSDWIYRSLEAGDWLPEENFTLKENFPVLSKNVIHSQCTNLFKEKGLFYVNDNVVLPKKNLIELIHLCGGRVTSSKVSASVLIGMNTQSPDKLHLSQDWVLDCISHGELLPTDNYSLLQTEDI